MAQGLTSTPQKREKGNDMGGAVSDVVGGIGDVIGGGVDVAGKMLKPAEKVFEWSTENPLEAAALATGAYFAAPALAGAFGGAGAAGAGAAEAAGGSSLFGNLWNPVAPELLGEASGTWASSAGAGGAGAGTGLLGGAVNWAAANPLSAAGLGLTAAKALGGSTPSSSTSSTSIDPEMKAAYLRNLEEARTTAAGLGTKQFAGFSDQYGTAEQQLRNMGLGGAGQTGTAEAARLSALESSYTPQQIAAAQAGQAQLAAAQGYTPQQIRDMQTGAQYMGAYQNPFENQVVQGALGDIEMARQRQGLTDRASATAAKAFGGSRQGVAESLTNEAALRNAASTAANLRSAGFNTAAQLGQTDAGRMLQMQLANQGASNQALQFGAGATNQAALANTAAQNQMAQYNASQLQQANIANQQANAQGAGIRLNAAGQMGNLAAQQQNLGIAGSQAVMNAEAQRQALEQAKLDAARNLSLERLGISQSALGLQPANLGGTTTTPIYKNQSASALGGALSGGMLGNMIGGSSGAGYGALAGGLLGLL
jgi:hypothetical protein